MTDPKANIVIGARNAAQRAFDKANKQMGTLDRTARRLTRGFGALAAAFGARELVQVADKMTLIENRLKIVTDSTADLINVQGALLDVSQNTRSSFEATVELYARVARSSDQLGLSQERLLNITQTVQQAIITSGATASEASAGLIQFAQGLASGALRGDELRSVLEQMPRLAEAIAEGMGVTIGDLRDLGKEGALSASAVLAALEDQSDVIRAEFELTDATVGQAATNIANSFTAAIGKIDDALGVTQHLAEFLQVLSVGIDEAFGTGARSVSELTSELVGTQTRIVELQSALQGIQRSDVRLFVEGQINELLTQEAALIERITALQNAQTDAMSENAARLAELQTVNPADFITNRQGPELDLLSAKEIARQQEREAFVENLTEELEIVRQHTLTRSEIEVEAFTRRLEILRSAFEQNLIEEERYHELRIALSQRTNEQLTAIQASEEKKRQASAAGALAMKLQSTVSTFAQLATVSAHGSETLFKIGKTAAIANAVVNTHAGVTRALAEYPPPLSFAMGAAVLAKGLAEIAAIKSQNFSGAGSLSAGGGSGGGSVTGGGAAVPQLPNIAQLEREQKPQVVVNVTVEGNVQSERDLATSIAEVLREDISERDVSIISPRSAQAQIIREGG